MKTYEVKLTVAVTAIDATSLGDIETRLLQRVVMHGLAPVVTSARVDSAIELQSSTTLERDT